MKITIDPAINSKADVSEHIIIANRFLESEVGSYGDGFTAEWGISNIPDKYCLNISDGKSNQMFLADQSQLADREWRELVMLQSASWVLGVHSKRNLKKINDAFRQIAEQELANAHS